MEIAVDWLQQENPGLQWVKLPCVVLVGASGCKATGKQLSHEFMSQKLDARWSINLINLYQ